MASSIIENDDIATPHFKLWKLVLGVLIAMLLISLFARQYASNISLPRYCENPQQTLNHLQQILTEKTPAGSKSRRPYIIAAKLLFLIPQKPDESQAEYLIRVEMQIQKTCR